MNDCVSINSRKYFCSDSFSKDILHYLLWILVELCANLFSKKSDFRLSADVIAHEFIYPMALSNKKTIKVTPCYIEDEAKMDEEGAKMCDVAL